MKVINPYQKPTLFSACSFLVTTRHAPILAQINIPYVPSLQSSLSLWSGCQQDNGLNAILRCHALRVNSSDLLVCKRILENRVLKLSR